MSSSNTADSITNNSSENSVNAPHHSPHHHSNVSSHSNTLEHLPIVDAVTVDLQSEDGSVDTDSANEDSREPNIVATKFINESDIGKEEKKDGEAPEKEKKGGRRKINIEFIENKSRRHVTFSKRKAGLIKKAYELSTLTGTQVLLLVASETGNVYTFATPKLQPLITKQEGKALIQGCLNPPEINEAVPQQQVPAQTPPPPNQRMMPPDASLYQNTPEKSKQSHQHPVPPQYADRYQKDPSKGMSSGLGDLSPYPSSYPTPMSAHSLGLTGGLPSSVPIYSYPVTMGGFVPSRGYPNFPTHPHQGNQYYTNTSSQLTSASASQLGNQYASPYLYPTNGSQYPPDGPSKDLV